jgi:hypothetical protein
MHIETTNSLPASDPRHHALNLERALEQLARHAREDIDKITDARGRVLLETTAEVLLGLAKANGDFGRGSEGAMR